MTGPTGFTGPAGAIYFQANQLDVSGLFPVWNSGTWNLSGKTNIVIGNNSGGIQRGQNQIAIGFSAGKDQSGNAIAIGNGAGLSQLDNSIAIGYGAGNTQNGNAIAIGFNCGSFQSEGSIAIGNAAAFGGDASSKQGQNSIAIGSYAGYNSSSAGQFKNSIILNATGQYLNTTDASGLFIAPINPFPYNTLSTALDYSNILLCYDVSNTKQISYKIITKTFVIDHPINEAKYLVHACLEGPEAGVYYRGKGKIINNTNVIIDLPDYVCSIARDFTIQITPIFSECNSIINTYNVSDVIDNHFTVYGLNGEFFWIVHGMRHQISIDPYKNISQVKGNPPYQWIE
jgi:hypothetical protein